MKDEFEPPKFRISKVVWEVYHTLLVIGVWLLFLVELAEFIWK